MWCVPVRFDGEVVAVMVRLQGPLRGSASLYEQQYLSVFERLCDMVSEATFPYREDGVAGPGLPRVGDGVILIDGDGRVEFATPTPLTRCIASGIYAPAEDAASPNWVSRARRSSAPWSSAFPPSRRSTAATTSRFFFTAFR